jgi:cobalt/nickel transport system permease protein
MPIFTLLAPVRLHIPDGFLSLGVSLVGWVLAIGAIGYALRQTRGQLGSKQIPLMGVVAAFIFAAQAINFPVAGGTSGHLLGGALAAVILGPWAAVLIMTAVIGVQALLFQDGGLLVLGFNIVNMGVITAFAGHLVYQLLKGLLGPGRTSLLAAGAAGAWISVMLGAGATAIELAVSGTSPLGVALPAMVAANWVAGGLVIALAVAALSPLASPNPDGLERVAEDTGFIGAALEPLYTILPDYTLPFVSNPVLSGLLAVVVGTLVVFGVAWAVARWQRRAPG